MNPSKVLRCSVRLTKLHKINNIPVGRGFSTNSQLLRQYSKVAGIAGAGIISIIAYGLSSDYKVYAYSKKNVSKPNKNQCILLKINILYTDKKSLLKIVASTKCFILIQIIIRYKRVIVLEHFYCWQISIYSLIYT